MHKRRESRLSVKVIKSSGDVYADLGIKRRRNPHHGSTLDNFLEEEGIGARAVKEAIARKRAKAAGARSKQVRRR